MAPFPPPPVSTIDWSNVGFKVREVNGHIESTFRYSSGSNPTWSKPRWVTSPHLSIHGMAPGLNYGVQCYEGMKAFRRPDGSISIFRPDQNAKRMQRSAEYISVPPVPEDLFVESVNLAVAMNAEYVPPHETGAAMYIRPLLFGSSAQLGLSPPDEYTFVVFVMPTGVYHGVHAVDALILEDFDRAAPEGTGSAKVGGNYAPVLRHSEKARNAGYGITLHLDSKTRTEIDEFSTSGFLGVRKDGDKVTVVVPDSKNVIKSVTSESACQIAKDVFGYNVERRRIAYEELPEFKEVMAAGTAASLVPIKSITMKSRGDTFEYPVNDKLEPGPVCTELLTTLKGIQQGKVKDQFGWNFTVTEPTQEFSKQAANGGVNGGVDQLP
ncbi:branched-chain amino acid aminotransferase [Exophiala spinifera]|uniref:Branched-chain amino acid aminotransferase n=1 Tax=Exophiala spinifera TaxID=91928 RepID=A0A0D1YRI9_9EURO|nr:branched-chain amino acid aminotransferase [Exophiala spinifera]KIW17871.1 branched-chain amino acid aminotransferase [Exophiala spinifera]